MFHALFMGLLGTIFFLHTLKTLLWMIPAQFFQILVFGYVTSRDPGHPKRSCVPGFNMYILKPGTCMYMYAYTGYHGVAQGATWWRIRAQKPKSKQTELWRLCKGPPLHVQQVWTAKFHHLDPVLGFPLPHIERGTQHMGWAWGPPKWAHNRA